VAPLFQLHCRSKVQALHNENLVAHQFICARQRLSSSKKWSPTYLSTYFDLRLRIAGFFISRIFRGALISQEDLPWNYSSCLMASNETNKSEVMMADVEHGNGVRKITVGNNVNSPIRTSAIGLLQHLQLLYLPSELDIDKQIQQVTLYFYYMQY
jgi:hypothetical protein